MIVHDRIRLIGQSPKNGNPALTRGISISMQKGHPFGRPSLAIMAHAAAALRRLGSSGRSHKRHQERRGRTKTSRSERSHSCVYA